MRGSITRRVAAVASTTGIALALGAVGTTTVAQADNLGSPDLNGYCRSLHGGNDLYAAGPMDLFDANSWKCVVPPGVPTDSVDVNAACHWQHGPSAMAVTNDPKAARSWSCQMANAPAGAPQTMTWSGTWFAGNITRQANLNLTSLDPISGIIDIPGLCTANWSESQRISDTQRVVNANVISGPCTNNRWNVTIAGNSLVGSDTAGRPGGFNLTRQ
jgi:hypothetical protein